MWAKTASVYWKGHVVTLEPVLMLEEVHERLVVLSTVSESTMDIRNGEKIQLRQSSVTLALNIEVESVDVVAFGGVGSLPNELSGNVVWSQVV